MGIESQERNMKVVCRHSRIDDDLANRCRLDGEAPRLYGSLTPGKEYIVLGITFSCGATAYGGHPAFEVENDAGWLSLAPAFLFEIVDGSASIHWRCRVRHNGVLELEPESFFRPYYHDDLSEGVPAVVQDFKEVCARFRAEEAERQRG
jgi:hypothetical protein